MTDPDTISPADIRFKRLRFRAWHRGTREADFLIGGFFDRYAAEWDATQIDWFERLLEEQDVDILAWAIGSAPAPAAFAGSQMEAMRALDYVRIPGWDHRASSAVN